VKKISALIAVAGLAAVASGQSYTIETRWVAVTTVAAAGGVGAQLGNFVEVGKNTANDIDVVVPGGTAANAIVYAQRFRLQARLVSQTGQAGNLGVLAVRGRINASEAAILNVQRNPAQPAGFTGGLGDVGPYNFGPSTEIFRTGGVANTLADRSDEIFNFSSDKDGFPQVSWGGTLGADGDGDGQPDVIPNAIPQPPAGTGIGNTWANIYTILVQVLNTGDRTVSVGMTHGDSRGLSSYTTVPNPPPPPTGNDSDFDGINDSVNPSVFNYSVNQMTGERTQLGSSFNVLVTPAPSSVALLGLGGLLAARRRRA
jgi:hypothetical protein